LLFTHLKYTISETTRYELNNFHTETPATARSGQVEIVLIGHQRIDHQGGDSHPADTTRHRRDPGTLSRDLLDACPSL
jgi:hypothetical protein